jgi:adenine-specific DNA-methyltransferase
MLQVCEKVIFRGQLRLGWSELAKGAGAAARWKVVVGSATAYSMPAPHAHCPGVRLAEDSMPTLTWRGKDAVLNHHLAVPYHVLKCDAEKSAGEAGSGNLIVEGDNLVALKALLPYYKGQVKCIYIDPPYNTGNEGWIYNDNVSSPEIKSWLGKVVGAEAEDLSRHDKWLCMMWPRLKLLKEFLREDAVIFVQIDDNEAHGLKLLMDEVFGRPNFVTTFVWQKVDSPNDNKVTITPDHEFIHCYALNLNRVKLFQKVDPALLRAFTNRDSEGRLYRDRLLKKNGKSSLREDRPSMYFGIEAPDGTIVFPVHDDGREARWAMGTKGVDEQQAAGTLVWKDRGKAGATKWIPYTREYAPDVPLRPHATILLDCLTSRQAKAHQKEFLPAGTEPFATPKTEQLMKRILEIATSPGDLVLDAFAGSGTTGAVAHKMERHWIIIEQGAHSQTHLLPRLRHVLAGTDPGGVSESTDWQGGGGFRYCKLGDPLFDALGGLNPGITRDAIAHHIYFTETGEPLAAPVPTIGNLIGVCGTRAFYLLYAADGSAVVNDESIATLEPFDGERVVFADACLLPEEWLREQRITFKQIPYDVRG